MENKYYAVINAVIENGAGSNPVTLELKNSDIRKIFRVLNILKTDLSIEFIDAETRNVIFEIFIDNQTSIKIVNNLLYVRRQGIFEFLIDENNLVRDIILDKALRMDYDNMQDILRLIYPYKRLKRRKGGRDKKCNCIPGYMKQKELKTKKRLKH